jgi:radical SAM superfamily enzyme YgiQ (UPF0313 family)
LIFSLGVENLKLYLMVGLPGERDEDVSAIVELVTSIRDRMVEEARHRGRVGKVIASVNPFIPKPGTPFQWHPMASQAELNRKIRFLKKALSAIPNVEARCKSPRQERLQALLALGDRRLAPAMMRLARGRVDLMKALELEELDLGFFIHRSRSMDETLPWNHIDNGMKRELLVSQYEKAKKGGYEEA